MKISMVFPAFNEEACIRQLITQALACLDNADREIIVVNDGSLDQTGCIADEMAKQHAPFLRVIHHPQNQGYGAALRSGFLAAKGDWIFYSDADGQFDLGELHSFLAAANDTDIFVGYRHNRQDRWFRLVTARIYNLLAQALFKTSVRDVDCAFKLFRKTVFDKIQIESNGFLIDLEILAKARTLGLSIAQRPVTHRPRVHGKSTVRFRDIIKTLQGMAWLKGRLKKEVSL